MTAGAPKARFTTLTITLEQNGRTTPLFTLAGSSAPTVTTIDQDHLRITRAIGKKDLPEL